MTIETDILKLGNNLKRLREKIGLSKKQLSIEAEVNLETIHIVEKGIGNPTINTLYKISKALKTDIFALCKGL